MPLPLMPFSGGRPDKSLKNLVRLAGLFANAELILDPGDRASWPGSGTTWFDVSGNGVHFTLGSASSPSASGPTFNGTVGARSANEYWSSAGGQGFSLTSGVNPAFIESMHKTGWNWTVVELVYLTSGYGAGFNTHTGAINSTNVGAFNYQASGAGYTAGQANGSSGVAVQSTHVAPTNALVMSGLGRKFNSNTSRDGTTYMNGLYDAANATTAFTPSASNASLAARLGLTSDGSTAMSAGRRMYGFMIFDHMLLQAEYDALRTQFLKRWSGI